MPFIPSAGAVAALQSIHSGHVGVMPDHFLICAAVSFTMLFIAVIFAVLGLCIGDDRFFDWVGVILPLSMLPILGDLIYILWAVIL